MVTFFLSSAQAPTILGSFPIHQTKTTTVFLAGDIMLSRNVAAAIYKAKDYTLPFQKISEFTKNADVAFANLESPFNDQGNHSIEGSLIFNADPKSIEGLNFAGFDVLSTANNHAFDQGKYGLDLTFNLLAQNHILPTGTMPTQDFDSLPIIEKNHIRFAFLSYSYTALNDGGKSHSPYIADFNDLVKLKQDIESIKSYKAADIIIVNMHAGVEYTRKPTQAQINFAHAAIDAGADLVVGAHPHWIQDIENYQGKYIFYSLGNFVFDQMWSTDTREGLTIKLSYKNKKLEKIELKPVVIDDYCCPRFANPDESKAILAKAGLTNSILMINN
jgi:poly-gamma-glutamate capsule biosynthesis protein CapA/YwtB (metallophosphatase superfamily)